MEHQCGRCGHRVRSNHRLPENHGCTGGLLPASEAAGGPELKPVDRPGRGGFRSVRRRWPAHHVTRQCSNERAVNATCSKRMSACRLRRAGNTIPPTPSMPAGVPVAEPTAGIPDTVESRYRQFGPASSPLHRYCVTTVAERRGRPVLGLRTLNHPPLGTPPQLREGGCQ